MLVNSSKAGKNPLQTKTSLDSHKKTLSLLQTLSLVPNDKLVKTKGTKKKLLTSDIARSILQSKKDSLDPIVDKIIVNNFPLLVKEAQGIGGPLLELVGKTYYNDTLQKRKIIKSALASFGKYLINHLADLGFQITPLSHKDSQLNKGSWGFLFWKSDNIVFLIGEGINKNAIRHETGHAIDHLLYQEWTGDKKTTLSRSPELGISRHYQKLKEVYDFKKSEIENFKDKLIKNYIDTSDKELAKKIENNPEEEKERIKKEHEAEWFNINTGIEFCEKIRELYPPGIKFITGYASTNPEEYFAECVSYYFNDKINKEYIEQIKNNWSGYPPKCYPPNRNNFPQFIDRLLRERPYANRETLAKEDPEMFKRLDKFFSNNGRNIEDLK